MYQVDKELTSTDTVHVQGVEDMTAGRNRRLAGHIVSILRKQKANRE